MMSSIPNLTSRSVIICHTQILKPVVYKNTIAVRACLFILIRNMDTEIYKGVDKRRVRKFKSLATLTFVSKEQFL